VWKTIPLRSININDSTNCAREILTAENHALHQKAALTFFTQLFTFTPVDG